MSLSGKYDDQNIFAKIIRGEMPSVKVFEDDSTLAFMDVFPVSDGHTLLIPKAGGARNFLELPAQYIETYMKNLQIITGAVRVALNPDGIRLMQFNGASAGQTVFHLHFHIIPVYDGVAMRPHGTGDMATPESLSPIAARIIEAI